VSKELCMMVFFRDYLRWLKIFLHKKLDLLFFLYYNLFVGWLLKNKKVIKMRMILLVLLCGFASVGLVTVLEGLKRWIWFGD